MTLMTQPFFIHKFKTGLYLLHFSIEFELSSNVKSSPLQKNKSTFIVAMQIIVVPLGQSFKENGCAASITLFQATLASRFRIRTIIFGEKRIIYANHFIK